MQTTCFSETFVSTFEFTRHHDPEQQIVKAVAVHTHEGFDMDVITAPESEDYLLREGWTLAINRSCGVHGGFVCLQVIIIIIVDLSAITE
jgi:hypothetical protein